MRRLAIALLVAPLAGLLGLSLLSPPAHADDEAAAEGLAPVDVMQVSGLFDEVTVDSIIEAIERAENNGSQALILQLNSGGAIVSDQRMVELLQRVSDAEVAIGVWVGPSRGSLAYGTPAQLLGVADVTAMVAGSRIGHTGDLLDPAVDLGPAADQLHHDSMSFAEARRLGILKLDTSDEGVPTVRSMVLAMDGVELADGKVLDTVSQELDDQGRTQNVSTLVRFSGLGLVDEVFHSVASPPIAYLFFVIGCCLLIFEFYTAGIGVAGLVGAVLTVLGCYGLAALPARPFAVGLLIVGLLTFAVDVQVGIPRFWTGVGATMFVLGSWLLYDPLPGTDLRLGWLTLLVGIGGVLVTFIVGMPSMVRSRFSTPTIGREWMIGEAGVAVGTINPEGVAQLGGSRWQARTNRGTPIAAGENLRVVAIDGVTLEVEPVESATMAL